ncbi:head decoration protein [Pseudoalteromonas luteoviolacea]|uniref:head decoration protein n=1 Tax=Pseudoalteromonas luteoviolacea TaxID=43657 RepID=UPI001B3654DD|nr:head decoration protein [Pseudoalteromonas luteoviolacea]MBQ4836046.1 head decoration protein [Pseudoalteromonas luteoviolacea]
MEQLIHEQLTAGDRPLTQNTGTFDASQTLLKLTPIARVTVTGHLKKWDPTANDGTQFAKFLTVGTVDTTAGAKAAPFYDGGHFNSDLVNWPVGATDAQKLGAFDGTPIAIGKVLE